MSKTLLHHRLLLFVFLAIQSKRGCSFVSRSTVHGPLFITAKVPKLTNIIRKRDISYMSESLQPDPILKTSRTLTLLKRFTLFTPFWTTCAAIWAIQNPTSSALFGSLSVLQPALMTLMFAMGLTITPQQLSDTLSSPSLLLLNVGLCYVMVPVLAWTLSHLLRYSTSQTAGLVLLGSVSGGQASNLFALLAKGDVALSVVCTLCTTLLGVVATPLLVQYLLGTAVNVESRGILRSVASLVLMPLVSGLVMRSLLSQRILNEASSWLPSFGVLATLVLVAGGASNLSLISFERSSLLAVVLPSCLLAVVSGLAAWWACRGLDSRARRTLVVETLSKSPTLAYVLATKHFDATAASIPAAAMVSLAVLGALVATLWSTVATERA